MFGFGVHEHQPIIRFWPNTEESWRVKHIGIGMRTLENRFDSIESNVCDFYSDNPRWDGSNVDVGVALVGFQTETGKKELSTER
jgi:hypothetical protein